MNSALGRGLDSLIPNKKDEPSTGQISDRPIQSVSQKTEDEGRDDYERVVELPVDKINPNSQQPRSIFDEGELKELQDSIKEHGLIQPIVVSKDGSQWQIIAGERRWRAVKALGQENIQAIVRSVDEQKKLELALIENIQRSNLNALDTASAYHRLIDEFNLSLDQLAKKVGKDSSTVSNTLRLLNIIELARKALREGKISEGHARVLAGLPEAEQLAVLNKILEEGMNVRDTEAEGRKVVVNKHIRKIHTDPEVVARAEQLQQFLGTKVAIKKSGEKGQIIIRFFSNDEFNDIFRKIGS